MKIKNLHEEIKDLDGKTVNQIKVEINSIIKKVKAVGDTRESLLKVLEEIKNEGKDFTYYDIYKESVFLIKSEQSNEFSEAVFIAQKLKEDGDFTVDELKTIKDRIPFHATSSGMIKGLAIVNLDQFTKESEKEKNKDDKKKG